MKVAYCSDLHLEFGDRSFTLPDADVLIIAGDICLGDDLYDTHIADQSEYTKQFFRDVSEKYADVLYIPGNHEYYAGIYDDGHSNMDQIDSNMGDFFYKNGLHNITYGQTINKVIGDVKFVGATLWTDINKNDPLSVSGYSVMNDYRRIMTDDDYLTPEYTMYLHDQHRKYISDQVAGVDKVVVVSHHAPNMGSVEYQPPSQISYFYGCTDMDDLILDSPQINYWIHGHTHSNSNYVIGDTRVLSNCRGYVGYANTSEFVVRVIDV
jgi:Icc-related predicted phosphoesterase